CRPTTRRTCTRPTPWRSPCTGSTRSRSGGGGGGSRRGSARWTRRARS
ncbi:MAG: hypothetical protein AVDCRST_MAG11-2585, partial [uncultured Gemmatimonadaceae bacterium]